jgi:polysaccharide deacetylase 2 family uncharacterized protein YibQ
VSDAQRGAFAALASVKTQIPEGPVSKATGCRFPSAGIGSAVLVFVSLLFAGCGELPPGKTQIRSVTAEATKTIRNAAGRGTAITTKTERVSFVGMLLQRPGAASITANIHDSKQADSLDKELTQIGQRHGLSVSESKSTDAVQLEFSELGLRTHSIRLQFPAEGEPNAEARPAATAPKLAIIVDDMGSDRESADSLVALHVPLTLSVLPDLTFSKEVADEAAIRGDQVMLHLPMQPESADAPAQPVELRDGMSEQQVRTTLAHMLASVPHAAGVNNHEGSKATSSRELMSDLMPALRERGLFFIDSRTSASTVAYRTAQHFGVRSASRKVFLDDTETRAAIAQQLDLAVTDAQRDGSAIAIGHPHPETISVLREQLPRLRQRGIQLVFASDLAH